MSFADFLLVLSAYCMFDAHAIVKCKQAPVVPLDRKLKSQSHVLFSVIFFSFDRDKNGKLDMEELMELLVALHGKHLEQNVRLAVAAIDKADIDITYDQLQRINKVGIVCFHSTIEFACLMCKEPMCSRILNN